MNKKLFYLYLFIISIFLIIGFLIFKNNTQKKLKDIETKFNKQALNHKSSCFSCEAQLSDEIAWSSNPTKCFSCQRELVGRSGNPNLGYIGSTIKYY